MCWCPHAGVKEISRDKVTAFDGTVAKPPAASKNSRVKEAAAAREQRLRSRLMESKVQAGPASGLSSASPGPDPAAAKYGVWPLLKYMIHIF